MRDEIDLLFDKLLANPQPVKKIKGQGRGKQSSPLILPDRPALADIPVTVAKKPHSFPIAKIERQPYKGKPLLKRRKARFMKGDKIYETTI